MGTSLHTNCHTTLTSKQTNTVPQEYPTKPEYEIIKLYFRTNKKALCSINSRHKMKSFLTADQKGPLWAQLSRTAGVWVLDSSLCCPQDAGPGQPRPGAEGHSVTTRASAQAWRGPPSHGHHWLPSAHGPCPPEGQAPRPHCSPALI